MPLLSIMLIVWGVLTAILVIMLIYRSMLTMREDDQLFLDQSESHMEKEQQELIARVQKVTLPVQILGGISGLLLIIIAVMAVYQQWMSQQ
jgi:cell division protein FtsL